MRLSRRMRSRSVHGAGLGLGLTRKQHQIIAEEEEEAAGAPPGLIYIDATMPNAIDAGMWVISIQVANIRSIYYLNWNHNDQDAISWKAYMPAGTYTLKALLVTASNQGIAKVKIDGVTVATFDNYAAATTRNVVKTQTSISVATAGVKTIQAIVDGKSGSSSDHYLGLHDMVFYRTA